MADLFRYFGIFDGYFRQGGEGVVGGEEWYIEGVLEELDIGREWYEILTEI